MHIKLYSKLNPKRLSQPIKDLTQLSDLLATTGEPLVVEAVSKQVNIDRVFHIRRNVTFIGEFVSQFVCHGDSIVEFQQATIYQPENMRYTVIMADDFVGEVRIHASKISVHPKSQDVALAGIGNGCRQLDIYDSQIDGGIFFVENLMLSGRVKFSSPIVADFACHLLETKNCDLKLVQTSIKHDVDLVEFDRLIIDGKCICSGGFYIKDLIIDDRLRSLELAVFTSHFNDPSIVRLDQVHLNKGNKNVTHIFVQKSNLQLLGSIGANVNWRIENSSVQMDAIQDDSSWSIGNQVSIQISDSATSKLRHVGSAQVIPKAEQASHLKEESVDFKNLDGLGKVEKKATDKIKEMIGQSLVKQQLADFVAQSEMDKLRVSRGLSDGSTITRNMVFSGPPGVGKTEFARLVGQALYENGVLPENKLVEVSAARDLVAGYLGQTADKTHEVAASAYGGVLFVDEAYALANDSDGQFGAKAMEQLLKEADDHRHELVVILAGYEDDMREMFETGNSGLKRRFPYWISFKNYSHDEFVDIFKLMLKHTKSVMSDALMNSKPFHDLLTSYADSHSNAGGVRNMLEALILARDSRLNQMGGSVSNDDLVRIIDKDLVTVYKRRVHDLKREQEARERYEESE